jgi:biopolymer transport protein ExbB
VGNNLMQADLSVWGMYHHADIVVKVVMIGLILASVVTWAIFFGKGAEILASKRRLKREQQQLAEARSLDQASDIASAFEAKSLTTQLINEAQNELELSAGAEDNEGIKERTGFRLERRVAAVGRHMGRGNGYLATIGAISPFVGLFGTVWGIMNSFIGIAQTQTTNLAVVAPGIAEALLATAIGLFAAIPAVVIYNIFARMIGSYKASLGGKGHEFWKRDFTGSSGLFSFVLSKRLNDAELAEYLDNFSLFSMAYSWGGFESLILANQPEQIAHIRPDAEVDFSGTLIRLHIGLENVDDLQADLAAGFARIV